MESKHTMYPEQIVAPMREELTRLGLEELRSPDAVRHALDGATGTQLVVVNSVCGCAARNARPAVALALAGEVRPDALYTVFAGQDAEATREARRYLTGYAPSSPSMALLQDGEVVLMLERWQIEGRSASEIAADLRAAFARYCGKPTV